MKQNKPEISRNLTSNKEKYISKPGIAISFDDSFRVNHWFEYGKRIFGFYEIPVTFNVNAFHHFEEERELNQYEIDLLLELQANGHEIAHHGFKHRRATNYVKEVGLEKWIEDDIIALFKWLENQEHSKTKEKFKTPVTYAFPHFISDENTIDALVPNYFKLVRGHTNVTNMLHHNHTGFSPSICIDQNFLNNSNNIRKILKWVKKTGYNIILTCHSILPKEIDWSQYNWGEESFYAGKWRTSPQVLQEIIQKAKEYELEFYRTSELAGVATFIDANFEKYVRELISNPNEKWIPISELIQIKELDLSNQNISNLDGLQYFINLEKIDLSNNPIRDFRLLDKLPKLEKTVYNSNNQTMSV